VKFNLYNRLVFNYAAWYFFPVAVIFSMQYWKAAVDQVVVKLIVVTRDIFVVAVSCCCYLRSVETCISVCLTIQTNLVFCFFSVVDSNS